MEISCFPALGQASDEGFSFLSFFLKCHFFCFSNSCTSSLSQDDVAVPTWLFVSAEPVVEKGGLL